MRFLPCCPPLHEVTPADRVAHARTLESRNIGEDEKKDTKRPRKVPNGAGGSRAPQNTCSLSALFHVPFASRCAATPRSHAVSNLRKHPCPPSPLQAA